ncbi:MAG: hypothetical protein EXR62_05585 [Chloroflexi bacterium]|nr:hypothetical protein [Chloroflexota bacterium]
MNESSRWLLRASGIVLLLLLLLGLGLLTMGYTAGLVFLLGVIVVWPVVWLFKSQLPKVRKLPLQTKLAGLAGLALVAYLVFPRGGTYYIVIPPDCNVRSYRAIITPENTSYKEFSIIDEIEPNPEFLKGKDFNPPTDWQIVGKDVGTKYRLPQRKITGTDRGLLLRELNFLPPQTLAVQFANQAAVSDLQVGICGQNTVELRDFPKSSIFRIKQVGDLKTFSYIDTETIRWSSTEVLEDDFKVAYIPPPFQRMRPVLEPFLGMSSLGDGFMGLIGFVGTLILIPLTKSTLYEMVSSRFKAWLGRSQPAASPETATLITSSRGDAKEVKIKKK